MKVIREATEMAARRDRLAEKLDAAFHYLTNDSPDDHWVKYENWLTEYRACCDALRHAEMVLT